MYLHGKLEKKHKLNALCKAKFDKPLKKSHEFSLGIFFDLRLCVHYIMLKKSVHFMNSFPTINFKERKYESSFWYAFL